MIGRTFIPRETRYADSRRGCGVSIGMIGDDSVRSGSEIKFEGILCDSRSGLNDCIKYEERSRSLVDSLWYFLICFSFQVLKLTYMLRSPVGEHVKRAVHSYDIGIAKRGRINKRPCIIQQIISNKRACQYDG